MKLIFTILIIAYLPCSVFGQSYFQKVFGDTAIIERGIGIHQLNDGSIFLMGHSQKGLVNDMQVTLVKLDENGTILWENSYGGLANDYPNSWVFIDSAFVIAGESQFQNGNIDGLVMVIDTAGNLLYSNNYGLATKTEVFRGISKTSDGGYLCTGFVTGNTGSGNDFYNLKLNPDFSSQWRKTTGTGVNEVGARGLELPNGNFFITGDQQQTGGNYNVYLQTLDANGNLIWDKTISSPQNGGSQNILMNSEGDILVVGEMNTPTSNAFDILLLKIKIDGTVVWSKFITNHPLGDAGFSILESDGGGYVVSGYGINPINDNQDVILLSVDTAGNPINSKYFGGGLSEIGFSVFPSIHGGFLIGGFTSQGADNQYFIIYDNVQVFVGTQPILNSEFTISPNPLTQNTIYFSQPLNEVNLSLFSLNGEFLEGTTLHQTSAYHIQKDLPTGYYFLTLKSKSSLKTFKLLINK